MTPPEEVSDITWRIRARRLASSAGLPRTAERASEKALEDWDDESRNRLLGALERQ